MTLEPYPAYVESGVDGIPSIPAGWTVKPIKSIAEAVAGGTPDTDNQDFWTETESGIAWVAISDMSSTSSVISTKKAVSDAGMAAARLYAGEPGTVLFAMYASVGEVSQLGIRATWNQALLGLMPMRGLSTSRFLFYALKNAKEQLPYLYRSNTQNNLNAQQVANMRLAVPEIEAQQEITDFLDVHTAKLDLLIGKQERLIETLAERRRAVISHAVTKGLNPSVPLKEAGVNWLGEVPVTWRVRPLWSLFERIKDVGHPDETMLSVFRNYGVVAKDDHANLNKTAENRNIYQLVAPGWLVTNRMKAWQGSVGVSELRGIVSGHYLCFRPRHSEVSRFLNYLFRSAPYADGYATLSRGVRIGQAEIDNDHYRVLPVLLPSTDEQSEIVRFLDRETAQIDALSAKAREMIDVLKERRQALISAAVTGKIDVRGLS
ncbi:restriction endonuclease subunit S [Mycetocola sp.]|uniref:restriction endonuclease subunit S n=1 Tax=Mycetocola sp. TaxID=1871042 RepID=UPI003989C9DF